MLETGLFFLLSWSAFLSAEAAGLTGQCFVWAAHRMCEYLCFPPLTKPPSLTLQEVKWIVSESASPGRKKKKKHPLYDSSIGSLQSADSSSLLAGQEGDVEIYE